MAKKFRTIVDPENIIVNKETGEVVGASIKRVCEKPEDFIKLYLSSIDDLLDLNQREFQILLVCIRSSQFYDEAEAKGNFFSNDARFKTNCRRLLDEELSDNNINMCISRLAAKKIIIRQSRGLFVMNPRYFFKGTITKKSRLELIATYEGTN
jgi:hypothetical protein